MPVRGKTLMGGTTLCPYCATRFKISEAQLAAHRGMVRCGQCLQIFDAGTDFTPDPPHPQLELPIADELHAVTGLAPGDVPATLDAHPVAEQSAQDEAIAVAGETPDAELPVTAASSDNAEQTGSIGNIEADQAVPAHHDEPASADIPLPADAPRSLTLAEQIAIVQDEDNGLAHKRRNWPWAIAAALLLLTLLAQAIYLFRVDLAAYRPELKAALVEYCRLLNCSLPLPQHVDAMSIESSGLEAEPGHESRIILSALLRNRAAYTQGFPSLELTLNDTQDKALARRTFRPADYLPLTENEKTGLLPNHELNIRLQLDTTDLRPTGYRLVLFYPSQS